MCSMDCDSASGCAVCSMYHSGVSALASSTRVSVARGHCSAACDALGAFATCVAEGDVCAVFEYFGGESIDCIGSVANVAVVGLRIVLAECAVTVFVLMVSLG